MRRSYTIPAERRVKAMEEYRKGLKPVWLICQESEIAPRTLYSWLNGKTNRGHRPPTRRSFPIALEEIELLRKIIRSGMKTAADGDAKTLSCLDERLFLLACDMYRSMHGEL